MNLGGRINTWAFEGYGMISTDGSTLYFASGRGGGSGGVDLWQAPILPGVDFDDDGVVQMGDLLTLIECWGTDERLCDIAPMPWGDGVVDAADLEVLMSYWGQVMREPAELVAHWKLDESEGMVAYDSAGTNDATLIGNPVWRPNGGQIGGALELDGAGDGIKTGFVVNPMETSLSVFAWVKGGVPGQIIISQTNGTNWLLTDPSKGYLMAGLQAPAPVGISLSSQTVVTDGEWHHVGLVCDLGARTLYVDGAKVARDTGGGLSDFQQTDGGLYIGAPNRLNFPGYWSGLIDDVQVYQGVVKP
ncbi:MAG: hypothetical protein A2Y77_01350 [Planctomycetes bacterium RBG_13_62_9]|nr:MAG: hypothetical protein A2Y77_01350 [Planctomycetes bacterium RBG_13_62_9]